MNKKDRQLIFDKYGGKCAYCGCELQKGWHIDEIEPVMRGRQYKKDINGERVWCTETRKFLTVPYVTYPERFNIDNQNPSCASCNINKHSMSLEDFRYLISGFTKYLNNKNTQYKVSKRYGLIQETGIEVKFYFEKI